LVVQGAFIGFCDREERRKHEKRSLSLCV